MVETEQLSPQVPRISAWKDASRKDRASNAPENVKKPLVWFWIGLGAQQKLPEDAFSACRRCCPFIPTRPAIVWAQAYGLKTPRQQDRGQSLYYQRPSPRSRWPIRALQMGSAELAKDIRSTWRKKCSFKNSLCTHDCATRALQPFSPSCSTRSTCELQDCALESESSSEGRCRPYRLGLRVLTGEAGHGFHKSGRRHGTCNVSKAKLAVASENEIRHQRMDWA